MIGLGPLPRVLASRHLADYEHHDIYLLEVWQVVGELSKGVDEGLLVLFFFCLLLLMRNVADEARDIYKIIFRNSTETVN